MEYEDLYTWLQRRRKAAVEEKQPEINIHIDLGDLARLLTDRGEVKVRDRTAPYPS